MQRFMLLLVGFLSGWCGTMTASATVVPKVVVPKVEVLAQQAHFSLDLENVPVGEELEVFAVLALPSGEYVGWNPSGMESGSFSPLWSGQHLDSFSIRSEAFELEAGEYTFYAGFDAQANGVIDTDLVYSVFPFSVDAKGVPDNRQPSANEQELRLLINLWRQEHKLTDLEWDERLYEQTATHSQWMQENQQLSHQGFSERLNTAACQGGNENIALASKTAMDKVLTLWKNSTGHNANLLSVTSNVMAVAQNGAYFTFISCHRP